MSDWIDLGKRKAVATMAILPPERRKEILAERRKKVEQQRWRVDGLTEAFSAIETMLEQEERSLGRMEADLRRLNETHAEMVAEEEAAEGGDPHS